MRIAKTFFVELVHCSEYNAFKNIFELFCVYYLTTDDSEKEQSLQCIKYDEEFWSTVELNKEDAKSAADDSGTIYKKSAWFKDCQQIYEQKLKLYKYKVITPKTMFIDFVMQHYVSIAPLWTSLLHNRKVQDPKQKFRCNTNNIESHWGTTKEAIRTNILELGKMSITAEKLLGFMKAQTKADIVRYRANIPKGRLNAR